MPATDFTKLNLKQRKYIDGLSKGMTRTEALRYAQYSETTRPTRVENASVKAAFARLIKRAVPAHLIAQRIAEGINAVETEFAKHEGKITDSRDVIAWSERRAYVELAARFGGYVEEEGSNPIVNLGIQVSVEHIGSQDQAAAKAK